jgi:hypothetical protein
MEIHNLESKSFLTLTPGGGKKIQVEVEATTARVRNHTFLQFSDFWSKNIWPTDIWPTDIEQTGVCLTEI